MTLGGQSKGLQGEYIVSAELEHALRGTHLCMSGTFICMHDQIRYLCTGEGT